MVENIVIFIAEITNKNYVFLWISESSFTGNNKIATAKQILKKNESDG